LKCEHVNAVEDPVSYPQSGPSWPDEPYQPESYTTEPPYGVQQYYPPPSPAPYAQQPPYPVSGQPGYPVSGQPAYPVSVPGYPDLAPVPPSRGSRGGLIALVASSAVLVLLVAGLAGLYLIRSSDDSNPSHAQESRGPATPSNAANSAKASSPAAGGTADYPARIILPATVAGMTKLDDPQLTKTADETATKLKSATNAESAVAGYYAPNGDVTRTVALVGVATRVNNPDAELRSAFSSTLTVSDVRDVDPGPLGGIMRCGNTSTGGTALAVCGWADGGSLAIGIFLNRSLTDSAELFRQIRGEVLQRG
jgi:hypothetical protein